jgi:antitoxin VapB
MGKEYPAKSFKSGNSVAIRMPAALRVEPDQEWTAGWENGKIVIEPKAKPKRKFNIEKVRGCAIGSGLQMLKPEDRVFEERKLIWDGPDWRAKHLPE